MSRPELLLKYRFQLESALAGIPEGSEQEQSVKLSALLVAAVELSLRIAGLESSEELRFELYQSALEGLDRVISQELDERAGRTET